MQPAWNSPACAVLSLSDPIVSDSTISYLSSYFSSQTLTTGSFSDIIEYEFIFNYITHSEVCMATIASLSAFQEVSLPQGTVRYYDQGTGPTLVFIHGLLANRLLWSRVIPQLVSHFRCIA